MKKISWWKNLLLFFRPTIIGYDIGISDYTCTIYWKELFGKFYIVDEDYK